MSSTTIQTKKKAIARSESASTQFLKNARSDCSVVKCGIAFGWRSDATRKPSRRSSHRCREEPGELDDRLSAHHLPVCERFPSDRWALRGASPAHTSPSTLRQRRSAGRRRAGRQPASGGNAGRDRRSRPQTGARRVSAGLGAGLRHTPAPLGAGCRLLREPRESTDSLQKEPEGVVFLPTSRARSVVPQSARCTQRALLRKTQEPRCMARHVVCSFECSRCVLNVPTTGKEGRDD